MVSMVGPGRTYHGFLEKTRPTMVFTYQGWVGPTMVFSARRRRKILRFLIQKHMDSLHRNAFPNRGITEKSACGGSFPLPIIVYISPWKSKYQIQEQNHGSTFDKNHGSTFSKKHGSTFSENHGSTLILVKTMVVHLAKTMVVHFAKKNMVVHFAKTMVVHLTKTTAAHLIKPW